MIGYIKGELIDIEENQIICEVSGIGYQLSMSTLAIGHLPKIGSIIKLYTYLYVREDALALYGFLTKEDLNLFKLLITVSGIGPKVALGIFKVFTSSDLKFAILADDEKAISKAPGIGAKSAKRMIMELKDKISMEETFESAHLEHKVDSSNNRDVKSDAILGLVSLGYSNTDAMKAVQSIPLSGAESTEDIIKLSLKQLF